MKRLLLTTMVSTAIWTGCRQKTEIENTATVKTSGCPENDAGANGREYRDKYTLPEMTRTGVRVFSRIVQRNQEMHRSQNGHPRAKANTDAVITMLTNMMAGGVHPIAFFATIADFESYQYQEFKDTDGIYKSKGFLFADKILGNTGSILPLYRAGYCGSDTCSSVFQVLVQSDWYSWCQNLNGTGADFWTLKNSDGTPYQGGGGKDFCATLWWWVEGDGGTNCQWLNNGRSATGPNVCTEPNHPWTRAQLQNAIKAYGQQKQCNGDWDQMHDAYIGAFAASKDPEVIEVNTIEKFRTKIGLGGGTASTQPNTNGDNTTTATTLQFTPTKQSYLYSSTLKIGMRCLLTANTKYTLSQEPLKRIEDGLAMWHVMLSGNHPPLKTPDGKECTLSSGYLDAADVKLL